MRIVFFGTPVFAVPSLQRLIDHSYEICGVFTQPDRPSGRGQKLQPSPIKILAQEQGIPVFQPDKIRAEENRSTIEQMQPDFIVVAAYGQILPAWLLNCARRMPVNIHASLLPQYRGAAPIARAILNGDAVTGISTMEVEETLDSGAILMQHEVPIPLKMTAGELTDELSKVGANLLIKTLSGLEKGTLKPLAQDESKVSWAPRVTKEMAPISWEKSALEIHNQVRAMNPWPGASTLFGSERIRIWRSMPTIAVNRGRALPGGLLELTQDGIRIQCGEGTILDILEVQKPSKGRISGRELAVGARLCIGDVAFPSITHTGQHPVS
jgi:methionyl-tRNA formyltransferase